MQEGPSCLLREGPAPTPADAAGHYQDPPPPLPTCPQAALPRAGPALTSTAAPPPLVASTALLLPDPLEPPHLPCGPSLPVPQLLRPPSAEVAAPAPESPEGLLGSPLHRMRKPGLREGK